VNGFLSTVRSAVRTLGERAVALLPPRTGTRASGPAPTVDPDEELTRLTGELAHEIRNPLSTVKINLQLAREALDEVMRAEEEGGKGRAEESRHVLSSRLPASRSSRLAGASRQIAVVQKETDRLEQILDGFLKYVRRPDLQLATVDLNELVGDMVDFYCPQAHRHVLTVRHSFSREPLLCRADPGALKQVLLNLFINAQQAMERRDSGTPGAPTADARAGSPAGGELMIRTSRHGARAAIQISDTGRGIPPERLPGIFRPYGSSRSGGTGLGLATARKIVEAHGGTISVHSEVGKGTSFTIELPLAVAKADPSDASAP